MTVSTMPSPTCCTSRSTWLAAPYPIVSPGCWSRFATYTRRAPRRSIASRIGGHQQRRQRRREQRAGPSTIRSARSIAATVSGCTSGSDGSSRRRRTPLRSDATADSPATTRPSSISATSTAGARVAVSTSPAMASACEVSATASSNEPASSVSAARNRLPRLWPASSPRENRCWNMLPMNDSSSASATRHAAHVAGRRDVEVAPQPSRRAAVVGQRHDRGRLLTDGLQPAQNRRQAGAAAEADDPRPPHRCSPSWRSRRRLYALPSGPHSPMLPSARITRW